MLSALRNRGMAAEDIRCYAQDPAYDAVDCEFLASIGITVVDDPKGFLEVDANTLVVSVTSSPKQPPVGSRSSAPREMAAHQDLAGTRLAKAQMESVGLYQRSRHLVRGLRPSAQQPRTAAQHPSAREACQTTSHDRPGKAKTSRTTSKS